MNCDEAFDALTDPHNDCGADLESHLRGCPRCRQMREVLAPALSLFSSVDESTDSDDFAHEGGDATATVRKQFLTVEAIQLAKDAALAMSSHEQTKAARRWTINSKAVQAAVAAAAVVAAFAIFAIPTGREPARINQAAATPVSNGPCLWKDQFRSEHELRPANLVVASCVECHLNAPVH